MIWALYILAFGPRAGTSSVIPFENKSLCEDAGKKITKKADDEYYVHYTCVKVKNNGRAN